MDGSKNVMSMTLLHHLRDLWKSPRGTIVRIEFLAGVAIITAFFLAAFGSSRRWSNRWIVQKGFFAAHALSLSLGTYSIGLMQTSPVKSEMYPIWAVSLFTLFGCIDPVTSYNGLDYKGPLSKMVFGISLNCGYVLLMSNSAISSDTSNTAINMLAAISFIKSFHRSLALVQQSKMRKRVQDLEGLHGDRSGLINDREYMVVDFTPVFPDDNWRRPRYPDKKGKRDYIFIKDVEDGLSGHKNELWYLSCYNACVAFGLSHKLQWHFLGLGYASYPHPQSAIHIDCTWALKVIEIELAFLYDIFFTGYPFLHYYQAKTASLWTLASFAGICFVGVAIVTPGPGTVTSRRTTVSPGGSTNIVDTTALDLVFTFVILVSIALLQLVHLIQGWTSNWARCAVGWAYGMMVWEESKLDRKRPFWWPWWMRVKASVATSTTWFNKYLWQEKIGQCSILPRARREKGRGRLTECEYILYQLYLRLFAPVIKLLGFHYVWKLLWDLLGNDTNKGATVRLDNDVKESIIQFLNHIKTDRLDGNWLHLTDEHPLFRFHLPYFHDDSPLKYRSESESDSHRYVSCVRMWYTATCYCAQAEQEPEEEQEEASLTKADEHISCRETAAGETERNQNRNRNRRVAKFLSRYCMYLMLSAPELLPGLAPETKSVNDSFVKSVMAPVQEQSEDEHHTDAHIYYKQGKVIAHQLLGGNPPLLDVTRRSDPWEMLALVWVRLLVYAAPYGNVEAHMRHLALGGEFITHVWALLYHFDIREWKLAEAKVQNITSIDHARRIRNQDNLAVVAFFGQQAPDENYRDHFVTASRLVDGVSFYETSSRDVAEILCDPTNNKLEAMNVLFLNKAGRPFFFGQSYGPYNIALFVYENKLFWAKEREKEAGPSTFHNPIPIEEQAPKARKKDIYTVVEIKEEVPRPS